MTLLKSVVSVLFEKKYVDVSLPPSTRVSFRTQRTSNKSPSKPVKIAVFDRSRKTLSTARVKTQPKFSFNKISAPFFKKPLPVAQPKAVPEILVGTITHLFEKIHVAVIKASKEIKTGETLHIKGPKTDFFQNVQSMQVDHKNVLKACRGEEFGLKLNQKACVGDGVFRASL